MTDFDPTSRPEAYRFILEQIDSVPHLEALMLLRDASPASWSVDELSARLYLPTDKVAAICRDLVRLWLFSETPGSPHRYAYFSRSPQQDELMEQVREAYRHDLVRISTMLHSKASSPVREFAKAFRFKKEQE